MTSKHTPAPPYDLTHLAMVGPDGIPIFLIPSATPDTALNAKRKAERAAIVRAVNTHEELLELLNNVIPWLEAAPVNPKVLVERIKQAIARAEGK